jgi:hypothetical protein
MLTLGQAAKETGLSKTAISRAIKSGRLSAKKNDQGEYEIDPAELFRVYPVTGDVNSERLRHTTPIDDGGLQGQLEILRELVRQIEGERDDLRRRLDRETEERRETQTKLTALLTHHPESKADTPPALPNIKRQPKTRAAVRPWLWVALAVASVAAAIVEWLVYRG